MCTMHYQRWYKHGDPLYVRPLIVGVAPCSIPGCEKVVAARGWCTAHWTRWKRHGSPAARLPGEVVDGKRICPECRQDKPLAELGRVYCRECYNARARRRPPKPVARHEAVCDCCGATFLGTKRNWRYCSRECFAAYKHRANWRHVTARRARERAALVEVFDRREVFERDGWRCGLCGEPIDKGIAWPDPMSASLDHVVPISRGGKHSRANAQAAHLTCNVHKGASLPEEVAA
jgi:5-methylcytosine-specific restriction endonuclease McrA